MTTRTSAAGRPAAVWLAVALLAALAFLSAVGGYLFNLSGADEAGEVLVGLIFVALALGYLASAVGLVRGRARARTAALALAGAHGAFNAIVKVGIEGETESIMFVVLTALVVATLWLPGTRRFATAAPRTA